MAYAPVEVPNINAAALPRPTNQDTVMKSQSPPSFRFLRPAPRFAAGVTASIAALSLAGFVFGPAADERALSIASTLRPAPVPVAANEAPAAARPPAGGERHFARMARADSR